MRNLLAILFVLWSGAAQADLMSRIYVTAVESFDHMPDIAVVHQISGECGADAHVHRDMAYCTSQNRVFVARDARLNPQAAYQLAHLLGHAVQVKHGIADIALREIRARPADEAQLRGFVVRQVECLAGFFFRKSGLSPASLQDWYGAEPFVGSHWGRDPLSVGPKVSIGLSAREEWFQIGQSGDLANCAVGEFGADLLLRAYQG